MTRRSAPTSNDTAARWRPDTLALVGGAAVAVAVGVVAGVVITKAANNDQPTATSPATVTATVISTVTAAPAAAPAPDAPPVAVASATIPGEGGTYIVGVDVQPGMYKAGPSRSGASCSWKRLSDLGDPNSIIMINNSDGPTYVRIEPTDAAFSTQFCTTWEPVR